MSQPTRARTTGAATRKPRREPTPPAPHSTGRVKSEEAVQPAVEHPPAVSPFAPETLARTLRAVAAELERDPVLARRVADAVALPQDAAAPPPSLAHGQPSPSDRFRSAGVSPASGTGQQDAIGILSSATASDAVPGGEDGGETEPKLRRVNRNFRPKLVTGASPDLGAGIPDPFALYGRLGEEGLRAALEELRLGTLRAIAREHGLDPKGTLARQNDAEKLRSAILKAAKKGRK